MLRSILLRFSLAAAAFTLEVHAHGACSAQDQETQETDVAALVQKADLKVVSHLEKGETGRKIQDGTKGVTIPKHIFIFWDKAPALPKFVGLCVDSIRRTNPGWEVTLLSKANLTKPPMLEPAGFDKLAIQHKADWLRLVLLKRYGGVWLDATTVPLKPVTSWVDVSINAVQGFKTPWYEPDCRCQILENWAIAAPAGNAFVESWLKEYERAIGMGFKNYKQELMSLGKASGKSYEVIGYNLPYLSQHAAFMRVRMARRSDRVVLHSSSQGPLWFVEASHYNASRAAKLLTSMSKEDCAFRDVPFLKLPGQECREVVRLLRAGNYKGNSVVHSSLGLPSSDLAETKTLLPWQSTSGKEVFLINAGSGSKCMGATRSSVAALGMQAIELGEPGVDAPKAALRNNVSEAAVRFASTMPGYAAQLLAHATAWKRIIDSHLRDALVVEAGTSLLISESELCSILSRYPRGAKLLQLATRPRGNVQFGSQSAGSCCDSDLDGDCSSWRSGGEHGSQAYLLTRAAAIQLYNRLQTGKLMWPTTAPVSYALQTASDAYHLKTSISKHSKALTRSCGKAVDVEGCGLVSDAAPPPSDHILASACATGIVSHQDAVRKIGFAIPKNGQHSALVEGGSSFHEATYLGELVRKMPSNSTLCQTGFNYGTSAVAMFCAADPGVQLYSWDLGEHPYVKPADALIQATFQKRHFLTLGDSTVTLKHAIAGKGPLPSHRKCDFVFVDGGRSNEVATADILNFKSLAHPGSMLVVDDCGEIGKPGADEAVSNAFMKAVADGHVVPAADVALRLHTDFQSKAHSICVGRYSSSSA